MESFIFFSTSEISWQWVSKRITYKIHLVTDHEIWDAKKSILQLNLCFLWLCQEMRTFSRQSSWFFVKVFLICFISLPYLCSLWKFSHSIDGNFWYIYEHTQAHYIHKTHLNIAVYKFSEWKVFFLLANGIEKGNNIKYTEQKNVNFDAVFFFSVVVDGIGQIKRKRQQQQRKKNKSLKFRSLLYRTIFPYIE